MNTSGNWDNLTASAKQVRLTDAERTSGRDMLASFMALTPRRAVVARRTFFARAATAFAAASVVALSAAGVAFAAEGALPGDVLYPVKVSVNEEVRSALTVDPESQARWETERAARRLAEAEALARKGALSERVQDELEAQVKVHTDRVKVAAEKMRQEDESDAASSTVADLEGTLHAHGRIIDAIAVERKEPSLALAESVRREEGSVAEERGRNDDAERASGKFSDGAQTRRRDVAAKKISEARAYLDSAPGVDVARAKLDAADERLAAGDAFVAAGDTNAAVGAYVDAQRIAQEALVIARATIDLHLKIGEASMAAPAREGEGRSREGRRARRQESAPVDVRGGEKADATMEDGAPHGRLRFRFGR